MEKKKNQANKRSVAKRKIRGKKTKQNESQYKQYIIILGTVISTPSNLLFTKKTVSRQ